MKSIKTLKASIIMLSVGLGAAFAYAEDDASSMEFCGNMPVFEDSADTPPLDFPIFVRGTNSGWAATPQYQFSYKGANKYQVRADYPQNSVFKIAVNDTNFTQQFWVPNINDTNLEQQSLSPNIEYPINWQDGGFANNIMYITGDVLMTFTLNEGAQQGDANAATLQINTCDDRDPSEFEVEDVRQFSKTSSIPLSPAAGGEVSIGPDGNTYIVSPGPGSNVVRVTPEGEVEVAFDGLIAPIGGHWARDGNFYIINDNNNTRGVILQITPDDVRTVIGEVPGSPQHIADDNDGNLYITDFFSSNITRITPEGEVEVFSSGAPAFGNVGIAYDELNNVLYVSNFFSGEIFSIDMLGIASKYAQAPAQLSFIDVLGDTIYSTGFFSGRIYETDSEGTTRRLGGNGSTLSVDNVTIFAEFNGPNGVAADPATNRVYISEFFNPTSLRVIDLDADLE